MPLQFIICLIAGALIAPSLAPFDTPYLSLIPPLVLFVSSYKRDRKKSALLGWAFGFGFFGSGVSWVFISISEHSQTPVAIAAVLTCLFVAALALLFSLQLYLWKR
jgi:apolipoprotein N-acyltransferase